MERKDLSFIPKKPVSSALYKAKKPASIAIYSVVLLLISGLFLGGVYFYKRFLQGSIDELIASIERAQLSIDPSLVNELNSMAGKIESAKSLLSKHKSLLPVFELLEESTLKTVRFLSFKYSLSSDNRAHIDLSGEAKSYSSLALQADSFRENTGIESFTISGISLGELGKVSFNVQMTIRSSLLIYKIDNE